MFEKHLSIYIFSYNRGQFLENIIESCKSYAPLATLTVVDDNSSDPATVEFLKKLPEQVNLIQPNKAEGTRHGGLYNNMQTALNSADSEWVLFIQDDMQLVRPLDESDYQYIEDFFNRFSSQAFLSPVFLKGQRHRRDKRITRINVDFPSYYREYPEKKHSTGLTYADVVIAHRKRLLEQDWNFSASERDNAKKAKESFGAMGFMAHPFVMYLPQVPVYRGKVKTLAVKIAEKLAGSEPKIFIDRDKPFWEQFKSRDLTKLPVAEEYLQCCDSRVKKPYQYSAVNAYPLLRVLHKLTLLFKFK